MNDEKYRTARRDKLMDLLQEVIEEDPKRAAMDIASIVLPVLQRIHPTTDSLAAIKSSYPSATKALVEERALSAEGVEWALSIFSQVGVIALDYLPRASVRAHVATDDREGGEVGRQVSSQIAEVYHGAIMQGLSPFGALVTILLSALRNAQEAGLNPMQAVRPLVEAVPIALRSMRPAPKQSPEMFEEMALAEVAQQMGISTKAARKYLDEAKRLKASGEWG